MDDITRKFETQVARIDRYPMNAEARARVVAEIEAIYRQEKAVMEGAISDQAANERARARRDRSLFP